MLPKVLFAAVLLSVFGVAHAVPPLEQGWYIGGALGASELDDDNFFVDNGLNLRDDEDSSAGIFGGYKFNRYFSLESRFTYLGEFDVSGADVDTDVVSVHGVLTLPIGRQGWELLWQLGVGRINFDFPGGDEDETVGSAGVGVRYYVTENLGLALKFDSYLFEADDAPNGRDYDIDINTAQFAVSYIF